MIRFNTAIHSVQLELAQARRSSVILNPNQVMYRKRNMKKDDDEKQSVREDIGYTTPTKHDLKSASGSFCDDDTVMPFGKYKGQRLSEVPDNYLTWFMDQPWADQWPGVLQYAEDRLS